jgi:hypothetical protein
MGRGVTRFVCFTAGRAIWVVKQAKKAVVACSRFSLQGADGVGDIAAVANDGGDPLFDRLSPHGEWLRTRKPP